MSAQPQDALRAIGKILTPAKSIVTSFKNLEGKDRDSIIIELIPVLTELDNLNKLLKEAKGKSRTPSSIFYRREKSLELDQADHAGAMVARHSLELNESLNAIKEYKKQYRFELALSKMLAKRLAKKAKKEAGEQGQSQPEA